MINYVKELFETELTSARISKESGVPENTVRRLRNGEAKLENATYKTLEALSSYYLKGVKKMRVYPKSWGREVYFYTKEEVYDYLRNKDLSFIAEKIEEEKPHKKSIIKEWFVSESTNGYVQSVDYMTENENVFCMYHAHSKKKNGVKIYYEDILVGSVKTNRSISVDEALELIGFDEEHFINAYGFDDIDYNDFRLEY